jgi:hypothetical protein
MRYDWQEVGYLQ